MPPKKDICLIKRGGSIKIPGPRINRTNSPASPDLLSEINNDTTIKKSRNK